jgi:hypothetical protein
VSKRCLFFTTHELSLVCHVGTKDATLFREFGPRQTQHNDLTDRHILLQFNSVWLSGSKDLDVILRGVWTAIEHYTKRQLSYRSDALNALSGIMSIASSIFGLAFLYGLPEQALDEALLWYPGSDCLRRNPDFPS